MSKRRRSRSSRAAKSASAPKRRPPAPVFELTRVVRAPEAPAGDRPTPLLDDRLARAAQAFERAAAESWGYGPSEPERSPPTRSVEREHAAPVIPAVVTERMHVVPAEALPASTRTRPSAPAPAVHGPVFDPAPASAPRASPVPPVSVDTATVDLGAEPEPWSTSPRRLARQRRSRGAFAVAMGLVCALGVLSTIRAMRNRVPADERSLASGLSAPPLTVLRALEPPLPTVLAEPSLAVATRLPAPGSVVTPVASPPPANAELVAASPNAKALTTQAVRALDVGKTTLAIELATRAVEADDTAARPYLVWGTALLERGRRAEAKEIFGRCTERATRGPRAECALLR